MKIRLPSLVKLSQEWKLWTFAWTFITGLDVGEYEFTIFPTVIFALPPDGMKEIIKPSFSISIHWGFWGYGVFCIKQKTSTPQQNSNTN